MTAYWRNRNRRATGNVMHPGLNYLTDLIVRPGIEKKLWPLLQYRGSMNFGHAHRLWNFALLMMAAEAETLSDGIKLAHNPAFSQLCGPVRKPSKMTLYTFFGRMWDTPFVTDNIPGFSEYVRSLQLGPSGLIEVPLETDLANCAPWRKSLHKNPGQEKGERGTKQLFYPFAIHDASKSEGHELVRFVNDAVPRGLPEHIRADVCQEIIIGVLSGDLPKGAVHDHVQEYIGKVFGGTEWKWGMGGGIRLSMDAPLAVSLENLQLHDVLHDGSYKHWSDEMEDDDGED